VVPDRRYGVSRIEHGGRGAWVSGQPPCAVAWTGGIRVGTHYCHDDPGHAGSHRCSCGDMKKTEIRVDGVWVDVTDLQAEAKQS
jgi:hypothetical protein